MIIKFLILCALYVLGAIVSTALFARLLPDRSERDIAVHGAIWPFGLLVIFVIALDRFHDFLLSRTKTAVKEIISLLVSVRESIISLLERVARWARG